MQVRELVGRHVAPKAPRTCVPRRPPQATIISRLVFVAKFAKRESTAEQLQGALDSVHSVQDRHYLGAAGTEAAHLSTLCWLPSAAFHSRVTGKRSGHCVLAPVRSVLLQAHRQALPGRGGDRDAPVLPNVFCKPP